MKVASIYIYIYISVVEASYDGPHLDDGKVTLEFVQELLRRFKDQKKIHKKYAYTVRSFCCINFHRLTQKERDESSSSVG